MPRRASTVDTKLAAPAIFLLRLENFVPENVSPRRCHSGGAAGDGSCGCFIENQPGWCAAVLLNRRANENTERP